jgi:hypothetical protein
LPGDFEQEIRKRVPGPGHYGQIEMNRLGKYYTSKIRNTRSITFGAPKKEYMNLDVKTGPGTCINLVI